MENSKLFSFKLQDLGAQDRAHNWFTTPPHPTSPYPNPQFYPAKKKTFNSTQGVFWETKKFKIMVKLSHN